MTTLNFKWTTKREKAVMALAQGHTERETADAVGVNERTIRRWKRNPEFATEMDRLSLMIGIASRAERLRIVMKVVRQKIQDEDRFVLTDRDLLDWMKFAQSETDGAKLDLAPIFEALEAAAEARDEAQGPLGSSVK